MTIGLVASSEIAIIDVDVIKTYIFQSFADHCIGLFFDKTLVDVHAKTVPGTPTHCWTFLPCCTGSYDKGGCKE